MALPLYNGRFILLVSASFITIFSSIAIYFCLPLLLSHVIREQVALSPASGSLGGWKSNSVVDRMYLYNITNMDELVLFSEEFQSNNNNNKQAKIIIPILTQIGPFAFRQDREKLNIKFDRANETVLYDQKKSWHFLPDSSIIKDLQELNTMTINHINLPLAATSLQDVDPYAEAINSIAYDQGLKLFLSHTVNELLFEGYPDVLMENAKSAGLLDTDKFGWMNTLNNTLTKDIRVFTGPSNATMSKFGSVDKFNFKDRLDVWSILSPNGNTTTDNLCNDFRFSSGGEFFAPPRNSIISHNSNKFDDDQDDLPDLNTNINNNNNNNNNENNPNSTTSRDIQNSDNISSIHQQSNNINNNNFNSNKHKSVSLFMADLCRSFELFYNHTYDFKGLTVDRYIANEYTYNYDQLTTSNNNRPRSYRQYQISLADNPGVVSMKKVDQSNPNECFCSVSKDAKSSSCPPNGLFDMSACRKGSNVIMSFPHFLYSNKDAKLIPHLRQFQDSQEPNEEEHSFYIDLESGMNIPVKAQVTLQFNVRLKYEPGFNFTRPFEFLFETKSQSGKSNKLNEFYLPQFWIQSKAEVDEENLRNLKFLQHNLSLVTPIVTITIFAIASILLTASAKMFFDLTYGSKSRKGSQSEFGQDTGSRCRPECEGMLSNYEMNDVGPSKS